VIKTTTTTLKMVVAADTPPVDVVICVEDTAQGGAYINDIK
jgi:hypothetical protein